MGAPFLQIEQSGGCLGEGVLAADDRIQGAGFDERKQLVPLSSHEARSEEGQGPPTDADNVDVVQQESVHLDHGDFASCETEYENPSLWRQAA